MVAVCNRDHHASLARPVSKHSLHTRFANPLMHYPFSTNFLEGSEIWTGKLCILLSTDSKMGNRPELRHGASEGILVDSEAVYPLR